MFASNSRGTSESESLTESLESHGQNSEATHEMLDQIHEKVKFLMVWQKSLSLYECDPQITGQSVCQIIQYIDGNENHRNHDLNSQFLCVHFYRFRDEIQRNNSSLLG